MKKKLICMLPPVPPGRQSQMVVQKKIADIPRNDDLYNSTGASRLSFASGELLSRMTRENADSISRPAGPFRIVGTLRSGQRSGHDN